MRLIITISNNLFDYWAKTNWFDQSGVVDS